MSKVVQTYDDGSELTRGDLAVSVGIGVAFTLAYVGFLQWKDNRSWKKLRKELQSGPQADQ